MAIRQHQPPAVSAVRGRNKAGSNKALGAPPRDDQPPGQRKGRGRVGRLTDAAAAAERARLEAVLVALDADSDAGTPVGTSTPAIVSAARDTLARSAADVAKLLVESIRQMFIAGQFASAANHAAKALELMEAKDPAGNVERVVTRTPRVTTPPAAPPNINVGFVLGGTRGAEAPHVPGVPHAVIDATPSAEAPQ